MTKLHDRSLDGEAIESGGLDTLYLLKDLGTFHYYEKSKETIELAEAKEKNNMT